MASPTPDFAAVRVLAQVLNQDRGPLGRQLVEAGLAVSPWASAALTREPGYLMAGAAVPETADPEQAAQRALAALAHALENFQASDAQVANGRAQLLQSLRTTQRDAEALSLALSESVAMGDWRLWFAMRDWIEAVTPADVQRAARTWLVPTNRTTGSFIATAQPPVRAPAAAAADVSALLAGYTGRAAAVAVEDFALTPQNIEARLAKLRLDIGGEPGLRLAVLPRRTKEDRVTGTLRLRWGSADTLQGQAVLASMLAPLLNQGTATKDADQIAQALLQMEAQLRLTSQVDNLTANFELPAKQFEPFVALLAELLQKSSFSDAAFARNQAAMLASLQGIKADTAAVAGNALQRVFTSRYSAGDPRASRSHAETEAQLRSASAQDLRAFWARFGGASHGEIALVGPLQPEEARATLQKHFGAWKSSEPRRPWIFEYPATPEPRWQSLLLPDKANANYAARIPLAMDDDAPDFAALFVGVQLLGGRAGTALWQRVREQEGLSYGVNASLFVPVSQRGEGGRAAAINISASFAPQNREKRHPRRDRAARGQWLQRPGGRLRAARHRKRPRRPAGAACRAGRHAGGESALGPRHAALRAPQRSLRQTRCRGRERGTAPLSGRDPHGRKHGGHLQRLIACCYLVSSGSGRGCCIRLSTCCCTCLCTCRLCCAGVCAADWPDTGAGATVAICFFASTPTMASTTTRPTRLNSMRMAALRLPYRPSVAIHCARARSFSLPAA
jgi:zinc protease